MTVAHVPPASKIAPLLNRQAIRTITIRLNPALAELLLARNTNNRGLSQRGLDRLVADIESGKWEVTHQSIAFSVASDLVDGQHRLTACSLAKRDILIRATYFTNTDVASLLEEAEVGDATIDLRVGGPVDGGVLRTAAATLAIRHGGGGTAWRRIGAHVRALELVRANAGQLSELVGPQGKTPSGDDFKRPPVAGIAISEAHIEAVYSKYRREIDWSLGAFSAGLSTAIAFPIALWMPMFEEEMALFAHQIRTGANLPERHPALVLRALDNAKKTRTSRETITLFCKSASLARSAARGDARSMVRASHDAWAFLTDARRKAGLP